MQRAQTRPLSVTVVTAATQRLNLSKHALTPGCGIEESSLPDEAMREDALSELFAGPCAEADVEMALSGRRLAAPREELMPDVENEGADLVEHIWHDVRRDDCQDFDACLIASQQFGRMKTASSAPQPHSLVLSEDAKSEQQKEGEERAVGSPFANSSWAADSSADSAPDSIWERLAALWQELLNDSALALGSSTRLRVQPAVHQTTTQHCAESMNANVTVEGEMRSVSDILSESF